MLLAKGKIFVIIYTTVRNGTTFHTAPSPFNDALDDGRQNKIVLVLSNV